MKGWFVITVLIVALGVSSCSDKLACSAYQSYFVLDNVNYPRNGYPLEKAEGLEASRFDYPDLSYHQIKNPIRDQYYAYLDVDSFPRETDVRKNEYGIVKKQRLRARERSLQTIPMEVVIPQAPDSILYAGDDELFAELDLVDSAAMDSVRSLGKTYQYNADQKYYLWYLRNKLKWEDEDEQEEEVPEETSAIEGEEAEQKEGFFKSIFGKISNLFNKKDTELDPAVDEEPLDEPAEEDSGDGFN